MPDRDPEQEQQAERIAYGLFALDAPLFGDHLNQWRQLPELRRDLYMAKARFVLSTAQTLG